MVHRQIMIPYRHFALPNLFLANGYKEFETEFGIEREYQREEELEKCVRSLVLRTPSPLRGWDLRFLRNGIGLSQAEFGQMIDRDAQTVARWEKSPNAVPRFADAMIRLRYAGLFEPSLGVAEVLAFSDGTAAPLPSRITLTLGFDGWRYSLTQSIKLSTIRTCANTDAEMLVEHYPMFKVLEGLESAERQYESPFEERFTIPDFDQYLPTRISKKALANSTYSRLTTLSPYRSQDTFDCEKHYVQ
jgi:DNA-binding transcriptional regulator YiaG